MFLSQTCSQCGHISQACSKCDHNSQTSNHGGANSIMLFGIQLTEGTKNTTNNNNNHPQYQQLPPQLFTSTNVTNASDKVVHASAECRKYKRGSWTEEEHKMFLKGLEVIGKSKWKAISEDFVKTRTPSQVASHAQKHYLLLRPNQNRRRSGKSSVFDLTIDADVDSSTIMKDAQIQQETVVPLSQPTPGAYQSKQNDGRPTNSPLPICLSPVPLSVWPLSWVDLSDNKTSSSTGTFPLSLKLQSLPPPDNHSPETTGHSSPSTSSSAFSIMYHHK